MLMPTLALFMLPLSVEELGQSSYTHCRYTHYTVLVGNITKNLLRFRPNNSAWLFLIIHLELLIKLKNYCIALILINSCILHVHPIAVHVLWFEVQQIVILNVGVSFPLSIFVSFFDSLTGDHKDLVASRILQHVLGERQFIKWGSGSVASRYSKGGGQ